MCSRNTASLDKEKIQWLTDDFAPFLDTVQSHHVFDFCLRDVDYANETIISSFAINEAFVRRLVKNRKRLGRLIIIWDTTMATRNISTLLFLNKQADAIYLTPNHSKIISMQCDSKNVVAVSSVNTTGNYRVEGGLVTSESSLVHFYHSQLIKIINSSGRWKNRYPK